MTVTIPTFDYASMYAQTPTVWRDRGLHWHAYSWRGTGREWADDAQRGSHSADVTPTAVRDWLKRPSRQIRATHATPDDAAAWVLENWTRARNEALNPVPEWAEDERLAATLYTLRCGNDVSNALWVRGPSIVSWTVVGTSDGCH